MKLKKEVLGKYERDQKQKRDEQIQWAAIWVQQVVDQIQQINGTEVTAERYKNFVEGDGGLMAEAIANTTRQQFKKAGLTSSSLLEMVLVADKAKYLNILKSMKANANISGRVSRLTVSNGKVIPIN